jgi:hypothetical protein
MHMPMPLVYRTVCTVFSIAPLLSLPYWAYANGADSPEKLAATRQTAYVSKDKTALNALYLPRGERQQIDATVSVVSHDFGRSILSVEWKENTNTNQPAGSYTGANGIVHTYCPVSGGTITVTCADTSPAVFQYGEENGRFYLVPTGSRPS